MGIGFRSKSFNDFRRILSIHSGSDLRALMSRTTAR